MDFSSSQNCANQLEGPDDEINTIKNINMEDFSYFIRDLNQSCPVVK